MRPSQTDIAEHLRLIRNAARVTRFRLETGIRSASNCRERKALHKNGYGRYLSDALTEDTMSAFTLYVIGFFLLLAGLAYGAYLVHVPYVWIGVGSLVLVGLGVMSAVSHTKQRDQPKEPSES
ncbi:MAG: hypothetical protein ABI740_02100 [Alphaproteobacteria bacterium]